MYIAPDHLLEAHREGCHYLFLMNSQQGYIPVFTNAASLEEMKTTCNKLVIDARQDVNNLILNDRKEIA